MANFNQVLKASTTETTTGNTEAVPGMAGIIGALFIVNVSAHSGTSTPTLKLEVQVQDPATGTWVNYAAIADITSNGTTTSIIYPNASGAIAQALPAAYRIAWTFTGTTPSFTFTIGACYLS